MDTVTDGELWAEAQVHLERARESFHNESWPQYTIAQHNFLAVMQELDERLAKTTTKPIPKLDWRGIDK